MTQPEHELKPQIEDVTPVETKWAVGRIITKEQPTPDTVRLRMHVEPRQRHAPGQHYLIRLRAPGDYTAQRSYSVASDDDDPLVEFLVERLPGGEVSLFLADVAEVGDLLEVRGPIGRWFVWDTRTRALCLVGGIGVVPAVAMLRTARRVGVTDHLTVAAVGRTPELLPYLEELQHAGAAVAFTRHDDGRRPAGALTRGELLPLLAAGQIAFVCGSSRFADYAVPLLLDCGVDPAAIRVEQFGATAEPAAADPRQPGRHRTMSRRTLHSAQGASWVQSSLMASHPMEPHQTGTRAVVRPMSPRTAGSMLAPRRVWPGEQQLARQGTFADGALPAPSVQQLGDALFVLVDAL